MVEGSTVHAAISVSAALLLDQYGNGGILVQACLVPFYHPDIELTSKTKTNPS